MAKVLYKKRNRIGYITLNRPDALNAQGRGLSQNVGIGLAALYI
jgi:enoyl-CoA hydratase/carnithine racemase